MDAPLLQVQAGATSNPSLSHRDYSRVDNNGSFTATTAFTTTIHGGLGTILTLLSVLYGILGVSARSWCSITVVAEQPVSLSFLVQQMGWWDFLIRHRQFPIPLAVYWATAVLLSSVGCGLAICCGGRSSHRRSIQNLVSVRWLFGVIYTLTLLGAVLETIQFQWSHTLLKVHSSPAIGLLSFCVALTCALLVAVLCKYKTMLEPYSDEDRQEDEEESVQMRILEEDPVLPTIAAPSPPDRSPVKFWKVLVVFQSGLASLLLVAPLFVLPLVQLEFEGVFAELLSDSQPRLYLFDITAATSLLQVVIGILLLLPIVVGPCACFALACAIWTSEGALRLQNQKYLQVLAPTMGSIVVATTLLVTTFCLGGWSERAFGQLCEPFLTESCLLVRGSPLVGLWIYVVHTVLLEVFVTLTLRWS